MKKEEIVWKMTNNLKQAMYEVNIILDNTDKNLIKRIPQKILKTIKEKAKKEKEFVYDKNKKLKDQEITDLTRGIIALIYKDYFCNQEQRNKYNNYYLKTKEQLELEKNKKYSVDKIFQKKNNNCTEEITDITIYKKETILTRVKNKFIKLLKK